METKLTLFQFETCPWCERVRQKLAEKNLEYEKVNVERDREDPKRKELAEKSNVFTVPVLKIEKDGEEKYIGESQVIIDYLDENF